MKTLFNTYKSLLLFFASCLAFSCDSFVEVEQPQSQLPSSAVFEDYSTATAALTDIYSNIRDKGILTGSAFGISNTAGCYADEITSTQNPSNSSLPFYNNSLLPSNTTIASQWNGTYNQIYSANAVLEGCEKSKVLTDIQKKQLKGESYFVRALLHFYLVNLFGDIPYIITTDYKTNSTMSRTPVEHVYQKITSDLENAVSLLPVNQIVPQKVRPNKTAAEALLARIYLFRNMYPEASNMASAVLNQSGTYNLESIENVFLISSKETIWQLQSGAAGLNTLQASFFTFSSAPPPLVSLNNDLVNKFPTGDLRKTKWVKAVSSSAGTWYHAYKYKENNATSTSKEYAVLLRLAEQYLIRSEARAFQGDLIGAKEDLNLIRRRAGLSDTPALSKDEIINAVLEERRWELFTEYGHRFMDLKRLGKLDSTLNSLKQGWNTDDRLFPIPQTEFSTNPNLGNQNPGY
ncbi:MULTISPECIES: RagB/SusD family nutrient uptake outer membrane protein [Flavobacterium]|uniref:RagB/SusD family nutrient uptake outer membrane protein n=1 Tax=Flavobacterium TaxID=237 RepID=UPI0009226A65|nr:MULTISPECIES: RagB/SusD family nutrient uptake outer membrane protein [Flavobacterium]MBJ2124323.1 RagB/SusD family nutrient uptake outer membrane protein [Flavobacterium sp. IB48]OXA74253.1 RagB/SusD family nutrient uptake outer membrane protein [Flavobacterium aquidurense]SHF90619.1 RagB/SusD domain-containing protein [Flavobacterium frigidimaris]